MKFTEKQIDDYQRYERIRKGGRWNMLSTEAREAAGLSREEHVFCMQNYTELKAQAEGKNVASN